MVNTAAVEVAKQRGGDGDNITTLSTGIRARVVPVAASLIDEVAARVSDPEVPMWYNPEKERDEPNPSDPAYLKALKQAERKRGIAATDAAVMFGVELVDGLPDDDGWLKKLRYMEKRGLLSLAEFDLEDEMDLEFLYKRYVAVTSQDLVLIMSRSGVQQEAVAQAVKSFPGDGAGNSAGGRPAVQEPQEPGQSAD